MTETKSGGEQQGTMAVESAIAPETTERARKQLRELKQAYGRTLGQAWRLGETLDEVKKCLNHGEWLPWLQKIRLDPRTAQKCLSLYKNYPDQIRLGTHFNTITQALRKVADKSPKGIAGGSGADAPSGNHASTTSREEPGADRPVSAPPDGSSAATLVSSEGSERKADLPLLPAIAGGVNGDSGSSDERLAASGGSGSDATAPMALSPSVGKHRNAAQLFVEEVRGALDRVRAVMGQSMRGSENLPKDVARASSLIQEVLSVMERRIECPQTDDFLVAVGPGLHALLEEPEDSSPSNVETSRVRTKGSAAPSRREQSESRSSGTSRVS